jgi:hypothetical protein
MVLRGWGDVMPSRATNEEVVIFCVFGDVEGNEIPVSGGLEGDLNFEKRVKRVFFRRVGACGATELRDGPKTVFEGGPALLAAKRAGVLTPATRALSERCGLYPRLAPSPPGSRLGLPSYARYAGSIAAKHLSEATQSRVSGQGLGNGGLRD